MNDPQSDRCIKTSQTSMMELFSKIVHGYYQKAPSQMSDRFLDMPHSVFYVCIQKGKNCMNIDSICLSDQYCQDSCTEHYECGESFVQPFANRISFFFWLLYLNFDQFFFSYFIQSRVFYSQLTLRQLIQTDLESRFIVRSQLVLSIQSGSSPSPRLQVVSQSTHL